MTTSRDQLHQNCLAIACQLEFSGGDDAASDFLEDALSIEYILDSQHKLLGAKILVACGGPNIWVNTRRDMVEGYWGSDRVELHYRDVNDLHGMCEELFEAGS